MRLRHAGVALIPKPAETLAQMLYFGVELLQQQGVGAVDENNRELDFLAVLGLKNISYSVDFPDQIEEGLGLVADSF